MSTFEKKLTHAEIQRALTREGEVAIPPIISPAQLAALLGLSVKTIYEWIARGRLDGCYRKRGKHALIWRDRVFDLIFNGPKWK
jgi:excisionase family DNA binding protein